VVHRHPLGLRPAQGRHARGLDVIPRDGDGSAIPSVWIDRAMPEVRPVLRLVFDDDFPKRSEKEREIWCSVWIATTLLPVLRAAVAGFTGRWAIGMDFARHRHFRSSSLPRSGRICAATCRS
jgi:phage FluMu gp28-like protein